MHLASKLPVVTTDRSFVVMMGRVAATLTKLVSGHDSPDKQAPRVNPHAELSRTAARCGAS